jgi:hypothetical protein
MLRQTPSQVSTSMTGTLRDNAAYAWDTFIGKKRIHVLNTHSRNHFGPDVELVSPTLLPLQTPTHSLEPTVTLRSSS